MSSPLKAKECKRCPLRQCSMLAGQRRRAMSRLTRRPRTRLTAVCRRLFSSMEETRSDGGELPSLRSSLSSVAAALFSANVRCRSEESCASAVHRCSECSVLLRPWGRKRDRTERMLNSGVFSALDAVRRSSWFSSELLSAFWCLSSLSSSALELSIAGYKSEEKKVANWTY